MGTQKNRLTELILLSTCNIGFGGRIRFLQHAKRPLSRALKMLTTTKVYFSVRIPRDFDVTNATVHRNILLRFRSKNKGNFFISSSFLMKHGAVYAAYRALSPVFQRSLISGLVCPNTSMNLFSKVINIA